MNELRDLLPRYDAVIVGARCAGAATALLLARQGLSVLVIDRGRYGSDTLSTHALMRGGVLQLHRWGLLGQVQEAGTPAMRRTSFFYAEEEVAVPIKARDGVDALYAPRRTVIDRLLVDAARAAGATVAYGLSLDSLRWSDPGRVAGIVALDDGRNERAISAPLVIGGDGLRSRLASLVEAPTYRQGRHAAGVVYTYWRGLDQSGYRWYFRPGVSIGSIPTNDGETCVFAGTTSQRFRDEIRHDVEAGFHRIIDECSPAFAGELRQGEQAAGFRGFPGHAGYFRRSSGPGWALVGDAAYFKDPITAHGITDALRDAELLARAVMRGSDAALQEYERERDEVAVGLFEVTDDIASFEWDLPTVKRKHKTLSDEMAREVLKMASADRAAA